ncbi:aquaporin [Viridothelium virens]|uniref:Aquaporin n=1 Tax=Viridothelium virens TaxID=1048519 RepID=A0A6A6H7M1_VIRVR|nr:aquaporin [Viridothelium virens]
MLSHKDSSEIMRIPWTMWMNSNAKNHFIAIIGEFVGTTMFLFLSFAGTSAAKTAVGTSTAFNPMVMLYVAVIFGLSLMVNVFIFFRVSGGLFNPAVSLGMAAVGAITPLRAFLLLIAQLSGAMLASELVKVLFPTPFDVKTTLSAGTSLAQGVFIEAILTAELVFTIFMLAKEKHKATYLAPVGIGFALFVAELVGVYYTGGSLNPARSFGPCVVTGKFDTEHWIYWVGPATGALISVFFYKFVKILEYETANPGQDDDHDEAESKSRLA